MKTKLIQIGNSQGVRIPKALIEESGLAGELEIVARKNTLVIRTASPPRAGWEDAFREMAAQGDDALLDGDAPSLSRFDAEEWQWE